MSDYFASDVHLRLDRPERSIRFARFVDRLDSTDRLTIVGDLCDFWLASRQFGPAPSACDGLRALRSFREGGGDLTILEGNHDASLLPFYERTLGARIVAEPFVVESHGLRLLLVHGHRLGARRPWKAWMESRLFLESFRKAPAPLADALDHLLERSNQSRRNTDEARHLATFRQFARDSGGGVDLVVFGHIHTAVDDTEASPRMIVLGGWHSSSSYLKIDDESARLVIESAPVLQSQPGPREASARTSHPESKAPWLDSTTTCTPDDTPPTA